METLVSGNQLGPYEIVGPLGAGGMGEVYRAKDPRLGREVAVKVLPAQFSADSDRLRRFEQEARAAGMLNHPNILIVYDSGAYEGCLYVVSELLEGETLRSRMGGSPLPPRKAVEYALQIAHGLAAAHEKGIVHRDLKPENLFITKDGRLKILDFGLAKLTAPEPAMAEQSSLQTVDPGTQPGIVLGTVVYMSPEQVRGHAADHRSDIFTLGAILYEMLTGKRAFHRDSIADTMSAILKEDPPELSRVNQSIPPGLQRVVNHCIEKSAGERFQSARDLAFDLEMISGVSSTTEAAVLPRPSRQLPRQAFLVLLLLVVALAAGIFIGKKLGPFKDQQQAKTSQPSFQRLTFRRGYVPAARFAPDGRTTIYAVAVGGNPTHLFSTRQESPESRPLGLPSAKILSISSSGEMAILLNPRFTAGWQSTGTLARVPIDGGAPREILKNVQEVDWAPNGKDFAVIRTSPGYRLEFPTGKVLYETTGWISHPRISPKADSIAFLDHPQPGDDRGFVAIVDANGNKKVLTTEWSSTSGLDWSQDGEEIWFTASAGSDRHSLRAVTASGQLRLILQTTANLILHDVSPSGDVLLAQDDRRREIMGVAPGETQEKDLSWFDYSLATDLSEDGQTLLFEEQGDGGGPNYSVYLRQTDGSPAVRLGEGSAIRLSPDKTWVLSALPVLPITLTILPAGAGESKTLTVPGIRLMLSTHWWFQDGKRLLLNGSEPGKEPRLWVYEMENGKVRSVTPEGVGDVSALISPDQESVLAPCKEEGFCLYPVDGGDSKRVPALIKGDEPVQWSMDGRSLYVRQGVLPAKIFLVDLSTGKRSLWKEIAPPDPTGIHGINLFLMTPDGKSYVYNYRRILSDLYLVKGLH